MATSKLLEEVDSLVDSQDELDQQLAALTPDKRLKQFAVLAPWLNDDHSSQLWQTNVVRIYTN